MRGTTVRSASLATVIGIIAACSGGPSGASPSVTPTTAPSAAVPVGVGSAPAPSSDRSDDLLADLDVGGRTMHILCVGPSDPGRPTVIFESGLGGDAGQWSDVLHELGGSVRACSYDRAGVGQSGPATIGRTTRDQVADLRALLTAADVEPPYLLVGFSLGGWNVMVHEDAHPDDVMGAVMVDVRPPEASARWLEALPAESATESDAIKMARAESTTFETDPTLNPEGLRLRDSATEAQESDGFGDKPLIVLAASNTAGISAGFEPELGATLEQIWWELQEELASRSSKGRLVKVDHTEHEIPVERPDAVAEAIREVLGD